MNASCRRVGAVVGVWSALAIAAACSSSSSGGGGQNGGNPDSSASSSSGSSGGSNGSSSSGGSSGGSSSSSGGSSGGSGSSSGASDAGGGDGGVTIVANVMLPHTPNVIASNTTTGMLYASMQQLDPEAGSYVGYGVAVVDSASDTVTSVIAPPTDGQGNAQIFYALAVDETANKVYAAPSFGPTLYVIDGASGAFTTPITLPGSNPSVFAMAVDGPGQRLYTLQPGPNGASSVIVGVIDTTTGMTVTTIPLPDLSQGTSGLAVDTTNHLLFACGYAYPSTNQSTAADTIDTTSNAVTGTQKTFDPATNGYFVGCRGGPGYATLVTNGATGYHALEPKDIDLPKGMVPDTFSIVAGKSVVVFGHDQSSGNVEMIGLIFNDVGLEDLNHQTYFLPITSYNLGEIFDSQPVKTGSSGTDAWVIVKIPTDGSDAVQSAVIHLRLQL